jgi:hypothetical protein
VVDMRNDAKISDVFLIGIHSSPLVMSLAILLYFSLDFNGESGYNITCEFCCSIKNKWGEFKTWQISNPQRKESRLLTREQRETEGSRII